MRFIGLDHHGRFGFPRRPCDGRWRSALRWPPPVFFALFSRYDHRLFVRHLLENHHRPQAGSGVSVRSANPTVTWVDEAASMSADARLYNSGVQGARSSVATKLPQAPSIPWTEGGSARVVRFDGEGPGLLIDRKLAVVTSGKAQNQALRQSAALQQNNLRGLWEVPDAAQAARARTMFQRLGINNIDVNVVPR